MKVNVLVMLALCGVLCLTGCTAKKSLYTKPDSKFRKLVFSDEFNYSGLPDSTKWGYEVGFVRNKEPQYYTKSRLENARVEGGSLVIEARKEAFEGYKGEPATYTSASLTTLGKQHFQYGRIEVRAKVPKGRGAWPAIWMLGENRGPVKWPNCGEIDIMEFTGRDSTLVYGTVHYADSTNKYRMEGKKPDFGAPYEDFHVYALEWDEKEIKIFYDGVNYFTFDVSRADQGNGENIFRKKFYLLLNLALGNGKNLGGVLHDEILPAKYYVDYVRVFH